MSTERRVLWVGLLFAAALVGGCGVRPTGDARTEADTRFAANKSLLAAVRDAGPPAVYEGLPHQYFDRERFEQERSQKPTLTLHGFPFYPAPLDVAPEDAAALTAVLADERMFEQLVSGKKCGEFHPDYLAEYRVGESAYRFLICFGCGEVRVFGPDGSLRCDVRHEARTSLEAPLKRYRKNRPAEQRP